MTPLHAATIATTPRILAGPQERAAARLCVFRLGERVLAVPVVRVREVMVIDDVTPVPRAAPHILGVASLRGTVVTLVSLEPLFGRPPREASRGARAIVLADPAVRVAIVVDEVMDLTAAGHIPGVTVLDPSTMLAKLKSEEAR
jgi:chemotaxis signal transduction protein